jgi:hypothetical protein
MAPERNRSKMEGKVTPGETPVGLRPPSVSPGEVGVGALGQGQRWTAARKREVVHYIRRVG